LDNPPSPWFGPFPIPTFRFLLMIVPTIGCMSIGDATRRSDLMAIAATFDDRGERNDIGGWAGGGEPAAWPQRRGNHVRRNARLSRFTPNLTPLLDVVLQLVTFFMMLVHFGTRVEGETLLVNLPEVPAALPSRDLAIDRLAVAIDAAGRLMVDDQLIDSPTSRQWWAAQARDRRLARAATGLGRAAADTLPTVVIVRADRAATYGAVRRVLAEAQSQGFQTFSVIVKRDRGAGGSP
jgi:biopolymer transport protein ExbD